jgi:hypothetical protein
MAKHWEVLQPLFCVDDGMFGYGVLLEPLWGLIVAFEDRSCRSAGRAELLASLEWHKELIANRFDGLIISEDATFLRVMVRS